MQVVVLAGGLGTRLRPLTGKIPKCMAVVAGKPFLYYLLRLLKARGADEAILCTGYLGEQVEKYFGHGREVGLKLRYSSERDVLMGTGGALKLAAPLLRDSFLVVNGDTYLDIDYDVVFREFEECKMPALIVASDGEHSARCDLAINEDMMVTCYDKTGVPGLRHVNAGVMALQERGRQCHRFAAAGIGWRKRISAPDKTRQR